jgi:hypothetical protein
MEIRIISGNICLRARLRDTPTAHAIAAALPIQSRTQTWGEEVYFSAPVRVELEADARDVVQAGELAFWTEGACIAIGYGRTPISQGNEIRLATRTNIWADAIDDVKQLAAIHAGEEINVEAIETT